jgi:antitoxin (DNA-binding transcriptional repressor) of toxin-antitoxin stability system
MGINVNIGEAKTRLSELVTASLRGEEVILSKAGKPVARIEALESAVADIIERERAERAAKMKAFMGSLKGKLGPQAADLIAEPAFTDIEIDNLSHGLGD